MRYTNRPFTREEDYWRWHALRNCRETDVHGKLWLWEDETGRVAAILHSESTHDAWLEGHPAHRSAQLEEEMMEVAGREFAELCPDGRRLLCFWVEDTDDLRLELMCRHGYERTEEAEYKRYCDLTQSLPQLPVPQGYAIRALGATLGTIGSWNEATHNLYEGLGFVQPDIVRVWLNCYITKGKICRYSTTSRILHCKIE